MGIPKSKQTAEESDESLDSDQTTQQPTPQPTLNVPRFLVVTSPDKDRKVSDRSPFVIEKIFSQSQDIRKNTTNVTVYIFMPPTLKKWGTYWFRLVRMCVCIHVPDIILKLYVWIPHGKIADAYFWFSLNNLPLFNYGPLTNKGMKSCKCHISKSIIARNLKLIMLIGDDD